MCEHSLGNNLSTVIRGRPRRGRRRPTAPGAPPRLRRGGGCSSGTAPARSPGGRLTAAFEAAAAAAVYPRPGVPRSHSLPPSSRPQPSLPRAAPAPSPARSLGGASTPAVAAAAVYPRPGAPRATSADPGPGVPGVRPRAPVVPTLVEILNVHACTKRQG